MKPTDQLQTRSCDEALKRCRQRTTLLSARIGDQERGLADEEDNMCIGLRLSAYGRSIGGLTHKAASLRDDPRQHIPLTLFCFSRRKRQILPNRLKGHDRRERDVR